VNSGAETFEFTALLRAVASNDESAFLTNLINLATKFDSGHSEAKSGFIDGYSFLFVTKQFPSLGNRQANYHFSLRCGGFY
jgi:hypothetical protein